MTRLIPALLAWLALSLPALATCGGEDLRPTMTPAERTALETALAARPFSEGNHWRATRGDAVVHLIGTMHLADPRFDGVVDRLTPLIEGADTLLLEMTALEKAEMQRSIVTDPDVMLMPDTTLPELLGDADWDRLSDSLRARGMPPFMAAKFQPWYVSTLLAMPACLNIADMAEAGLDMRLEKIADSAGVSKTALEGADTALRAFGSVPRDIQVSMIRAALSAPEVNADLFTTLIDAYFEEAHAQSWLVAQVLAPRLAPVAADAAEEANAALESVLLDDRNRAWIPVIVATAEAADGPVVAAFGAGHLSGEAGVLALLQAEGFTLERLPF